MRAGLILILPMMLAACGQNEERVAFNGVEFRSDADTIGDDLRNFSLAISPVSASLEGAREAGRYEGTRYCITNYGTSRILWSLGPDSDPASYRIQNDVLTFQGRCNPR